MTARAKYQNFAVDNSGDVVSGSQVEVREFYSNALATLYEAETGATPAYGGLNPFQAGNGSPDPTGYFEFWVPPGLYSITVGTAPTQTTYLQYLVATAKTDFDSRAELVTAVAAGARWPDGTLINWKSAWGSTMVVRAKSGSTAIADMPGLEPSGMVYPDIWSDSTIDLTAAWQSANDYSGALDAGQRHVIYLDAHEYPVSATVTCRRSQTTIRGMGSSSTRVVRSGDYGDTLDWMAADPTTNRLADISLEGISFRQNANMTNGAHVHMSDMIRVRIDDVQCWDGFIGMRLRGLQNSNVSRTEIQAGTHWGAAPVGSRFVSIEDAQNASNKTSALFFSELNWERTGSDLGVNPQKVEYGVEIGACDGVWFDTGHIMGAKRTFHVEPSSSTRKLQRIIVDNVWFDQFCDYDLYVTGNTTDGFGDITFTGCTSSNAEVKSIHVDDSCEDFESLKISGGDWSIASTATVLADLQRGTHFEFDGVALLSKQSMFAASVGINVGNPVRNITVSGGKIGTTITGQPMAIGIKFNGTTPNANISGVQFHGVSEEIEFIGPLRDGSKIEGISTTRANYNRDTGAAQLAISACTEDGDIITTAADLNELRYGWSGRVVTYRSNGITTTIKHNTGGGGNGIWCSTGADISLTTGRYCRFTYHALRGVWLAEQIY